MLHIDLYLTPGERSPERYDKMEKLKTVAKWGGPAAALLALHVAVRGVPDVAVAALLVGAGVLLSWGTPKLVALVKRKVS